MKLAVFGGTFNPVHNGHLHLLAAFDRALSFDRILCMVDNLPPHKSSEGLAAGEHRLAMTRLAFADNPKVTVSDLELRKEGRSYTIDTLSRLQQMYPEDTLYFLMGSDMFLTFEQWRDYQKIAQMAVLCTLSRDETSFEALCRHKEKLTGVGARCEIIRGRPLVVSSTQVRIHLQRGEPVSHLVPSAVADYIEQHRLYGAEPKPAY